MRDQRQGCDGKDLCKWHGVDGQHAKRHRDVDSRQATRLRLHATMLYQ